MLAPLPLLPTMGVGSAASPGWFVAGQRQAREGSFGAGDATELYEDATRIAIADQIEAGLDVVSDGELHRQRFVFEMFGHLAGLKRVAPQRRLGVPGYDMAPHFAVEGTIAAPRGLGVVEEFRTLKRLAPGRRLKVALPGPLTFAGFMVSGGHRPDAILEQLIGIVRTELQGLIAEGADFVQLDEPGWTIPSPDIPVAEAAEVVNRTLAGLRARRAVHVCFGNNAGRPAADRRLAPLLDGIGRLDCELLVLEFANREMAEIEAMAALTPRYAIAAGVIDVKNFYLETPERVAERIELCLHQVPAERLWLTADCGFSALPRGLAVAKMRALVEGARIVRQRRGT
jgi:5-methyltetrahydropteroyltriglutamate--homocysteine methyltransferase